MAKVVEHGIAGARPRIQSPVQGKQKKKKTPVFSLFI
jgi:hypothetical protein